MKKLMLIMALFVVSPVVKSQENTYLVPERANMGINAAVR
jgi:anaerobic C4-dicarboxylate transporter